MSHACPGPGCTATVPTEMLACRRHWFQVSKPVRDAVWRAWRALQSDPGVDGDPIAAEEEHGRAMAAAIAEMKP